MAGKRDLRIALWLTAATPCHAGEHAACTDPAFDWTTLSPGELRTIAGACSTPSFG